MIQRPVEDDRIFKAKTTKNAEITVAASQEDSDMVGVSGLFVIQCLAPLAVGIGIALLQTRHVRMSQMADYVNFRSVQQGDEDELHKKISRH